MCIVVQLCTYLLIAIIMIFLELGLIARFGGGEPGAGGGAVPGTAFGFVSGIQPDGVFTRFRLAV